MTQPAAEQPRRIPLDELTSDALDQLYADLAEAQRQVVAWKTRAGIRATQRRQHERRAERAEAAIERVRATCDRLDAAALSAEGVPLTARERGMHTATTRIRAALDEHQEQPT